MFRLAAIENIFFLVLIAIVGLVRWIAQVAENKRNTDAAKRAVPPPNVPPPRAPATTEEERVRRFMEALGVPTSNSPPPKAQPRQATPKKPREEKKVRPIDPFPRPNFGPWKPEPVTPPTPPPILLDTPLPTRAITIPAMPPPLPVATTAPDEFAFQVIEKPSEDVQAASSKRDWGGRLATAGGLRDAMVLREIFGPPRSMQMTIETREISGIA